MNVTKIITETIESTFADLIGEDVRRGTTDTLPFLLRIRLEDASSDFARWLYARYKAEKEYAEAMAKDRARDTVTP